VRPVFSIIVLVIAMGNAPRIFAIQESTNQVDGARRLLIEASHLLKDIPDSQQSSAVENIAGQLTRAGDLPDALATTHMLKNAGAQSHATGSIAWQLAHAGNFAEAIALVDSMPDDQNKESNYETLAALIAEKGDLEIALQTAHRCKDRIGIANALLRIARERAKRKDLSGAKEVFGEAIDLSNKAVEEDPAKVTFLGEIASAQAETGDMAGAFRTVDEFSAIAHRQGTEGNELLLQVLASAQARIGDVSGAQRTVAEMTSGNNPVFALMAISQEQAKRGLLVDALETAELISDSGLKSSALREIGILNGTHGTLQDALEAIDRISQPSARAEAIAALALEQAVSENTAASSTLQAALNIATESASQASDKPLEMIAVTRALLGDFAGAQQIVQNMAEPESRVWPLWNITSMLVEAGHTQEALALAENQDAAYPKAYALLGAAQGMLNRVDAETAASRKH